MKPKKTRRILAVVDGVVIRAHDRATEWADCSVCGVRLTGMEPSAPDDWQGECYYCGAPASRVGLRDAE